MKNNSKVAIYIRLSKEDQKSEYVYESESISNQRSFLLKYLKENNYYDIEEYVDDGYSGTTFNRPAFKRLLLDIENGKINMVVTKDLSRLGRDYIKSGYYLEEYFPLHNVRYISLLDGIDTYLNVTSNELAPFKALFNDMVSKDTSKKIKAILQNKKEQGLFLGGKAPYGYKKDPSDKHHLIKDPNTSKNVEFIYKCALKNKSLSSIANILNNMNILSSKGKKWTISSVNNILKNIEYTGSLLSSVWTTVSYKNRKRIKKSPDDWIYIKNTHEAIIPLNIYQKVQKKLKKKRKIPKKRERLLLEGTIYCEECKNLLKVLFRNGKYILKCNTCNKKVTSYYLLEDTILRELTKFSLLKNKKITSSLIKYLINKIIINKEKEITIYYSFKEEL